MTPPDSRPEVAVAFLRRDGKYLMQLRDDNPQIIYPGHWGLFGGHIEPGESADVAVRRELQEEIGYVPAELHKYGCFPDTNVIRHIYYGNLDVEPSQLVQTEGIDMDLLSPTDIEAGNHFSDRIQEIRPIGSPHRRLLLAFIQEFGP